MLACLDTRAFSLSDEPAGRQRSTSVGRGMLKAARRENTCYPPLSGFNAPISEHVVGEVQTPGCGSDHRPPGRRGAGSPTPNFTPETGADA
jgi:hypothetical protein